MPNPTPIDIRLPAEPGPKPVFMQQKRVLGLPVLTLLGGNFRGDLTAVWPKAFPDASYEVDFSIWETSLSLNVSIGEVSKTPEQVVLRVSSLLSLNLVGKIKITGTWGDTAWS